MSFTPFGTDQQGRHVWRCDHCPVTTTKQEVMDAHVCAGTELGKTTTDDEADRILEAAQGKVALGLEAFATIAQARMLQTLIKTTEGRLTQASRLRASAQSSRQAGAVEGQIKAETEHIDFMRRLYCQLESEVEAAGWHL